MIISYRQFDLKLTGGYFDEIFNELIRNSKSLSIIIVGVETKIRIKFKSNQSIESRTAHYFHPNWLQNQS